LGIEATISSDVLIIFLLLKGLNSLIISGTDNGGRSTAAEVAISRKIFKEIVFLIDRLRCFMIKYYTSIE